MEHIYKRPLGFRTRVFQTLYNFQLVVRKPKFYYVKLIFHKSISLEKMLKYLYFLKIKLKILNVLFFEFFALYLLEKNK